jgi:type III polyketide synthase
LLTAFIVGWKVVLTPRVPKMAGASISPTFKDLMASLSLPAEYQKPDDFDWCMHPGGATILTGAERALGISPEHMRASYDTYINHGNSSSATIFSVMDRMRSKDMDALAPGGRAPREYVVGCAFGPGISVEMNMLRRNLEHGGRRTGINGLQTPPETESEASDDVGEGRLEASVEGFIAEALENVEVD